MAKEALLEFEGTVSERWPNATYSVMRGQRLDAYRATRDAIQKRIMTRFAESQAGDT